MNLIDSLFELTGEINCRMKHKQKPKEKTTNEQITTLLGSWIQFLFVHMQFYLLNEAKSEAGPMAVQVTYFRITVRLCFTLN